MEKKSAKRKLRRKYKRYAAAVASAAIITGAALPGIPASKALAAEKSPTSPPTRTEQTTAVNKDAPKPGRLRNGWHEHRHSWPGSDENQGWYENGRIYYRSDSRDKYDDVYYYSSDLVDFVKGHASAYGFDRYLDSFTLLSRSRTSATIQIKKHDTGQRFIVELTRNAYRDWEIVGVRAI